MTGEVFAALDAFERRSDSTVDAEFVAAHDQLVAELAEFRVAAANFERLEPWLASLTAAVEATSMLPSSAPPSASRAIASADHDGPISTSVSPIDALARTEVLGELRRPATVQPANRLRLGVDLADQLAETGDLRPRLLAALQPAYTSVLYQALGGAAVSVPSPVEVFAFRVRSPLYGHNAPERPYAFNTKTGRVKRSGDPDPHEIDHIVDLATPFDQILPGSWVVVRPLDLPRREDELADDGDDNVEIVRAATLADPVRADVHFARVGSVDPTLSRADYGVASSITRIELVDPAVPSESVRWFENESYGLVRGTDVLTQAEPLELANEPIELDVDGDEVELDRLHDGLEPGRWVIVAGERALEGVDGVPAAELVMIAGVEHRADATRPGEQLHTFLRLAGTSASGTAGLSYTYRRPTVRIYGNVVKATNGESNEQVLGSGDGRAANQRFRLRGAPLTHVSAPTPAGSTPELEVRVDGVRWRRVDHVLQLGPNDRAYLVRTDDDAVTSIVFGDGVDGARVPTGAENVAALYRLGLGLQGNVDAEVIDTLIDRPLGVKEVVNPIRASGGADAEGLDAARENAPKAVLALDRLVAARDYADLASTFAGVAKADARLLATRGGRLLHLTVALAGGVPFDHNSDVARNLRQTLRRLRRSPARRAHRRCQGEAPAAQRRCAGASDHRWEDVEPRVRAAIETTFGFDARPLGRGVSTSRVLATIDGVLGVDHVDLDVLEAVNEDDLLARVASDTDPVGGNGVGAAGGRLGEHAGPPSHIGADVARVLPDGGIVAADLVYADPTVRDTIVLQELLR